MIQIKDQPGRRTMIRQTLQERAMRLTTRTSLALQTLMYCAANPGQTVRKHDAAIACHASENHLAQVIHALSLTGFLTTVRGRSGGLRLARDPSKIAVGDVVRKFESPLPFAPCMENGDTCHLSACCRLKCAFDDALTAFHAVLDRVTLEDLVKDNTELKKLMQFA
jgi:Rrf2 family transcriptional regulator, nitric oxide-sensitive transcriptional repressor